MTSKNTYDNVNDGEDNSEAVPEEKAKKPSRLLSGSAAGVLSLCLVGGGLFTFNSLGGNNDLTQTPVNVTTPTADSTAPVTPPRPSRDLHRGSEKSDGIPKPTLSHVSKASQTTAQEHGGTSEGERMDKSVKATREALQTSSPIMKSSAPAPSPTSSAKKAAKSSPSSSASAKAKKAAVPASASTAPVVSYSPVPLAANLSPNPVAPGGTEDGISYRVDGGGHWIISGTYQGKDIEKTVQMAMKYPNGQIPKSLLCTFSTATLRCDAAAQLSLLNKAYHNQFGSNLSFTQGYRPLAEQYSIKADYIARGIGGFAVTPGTSNHGLGQAMDFAGPASFSGTAQNAWLVKNAESYGWIWPYAMRPGGGGPPEPWHFDFMGPGVGGSTGYSLRGGGKATQPVVAVPKPSAPASPKPSTGPQATRPPKNTATGSGSPTAPPKGTSAPIAPSSPPSTKIPAPPAPSSSPPSAPGITPQGQLPSPSSSGSASNAPVNRPISK